MKHRSLSLVQWNVKLWCPAKGARKCSETTWRNRAAAASLQSAPNNLLEPQDSTCPLLPKGMPASKLESSPQKTGCNAAFKGCRNDGSKQACCMPTVLLWSMACQSFLCRALTSSRVTLQKCSRLYQLSQVKHWIPKACWPLQQGGLVCRGVAALVFIKQSQELG